MEIGTIHNGGAYVDRKKTVYSKELSEAEEIFARSQNSFYKKTNGSKNEKQKDFLEKYVVGF